MTLALRLSQHGRQVTLLEAAPQLGGLAAPWSLGPITWDRHYHVTLSSDTDLRQLLSDLQLDSEICWRQVPTGFFAAGRLHPFATGWDFLRFPPLGFASKLRLGLTILYLSRLKNGTRLEAIPLEAWLRRASGNRTWERFWRPLLRAKLGDNYQQTSAAFMWATVSRLSAARRNGLGQERFGYVRGGYRVIIERLQNELQRGGVQIRCGTPVQRVVAAQNRLNMHTASGSESFDRIVWTVPSDTVADTCPQLREDERRGLSAIRYQGILCASLLLKRPLTHYYVTNLADDRIPFTGIIEMTALVDPKELNGLHLVYLPWYVPSDSDHFQRNEDELRRDYWNGLRIVHPELQEEDLVAFRLSRVRRVMPIPTLHYSRLVPPLRTSLPGMYVANSSQIVQGTLNVNETVKLAEDTVGQLLRANPHRSTDRSDAQAVR